MKKLIILLLALTGCIGTVNATEYTVVFKPYSSNIGNPDGNWPDANAKIYLRMKKSDDSSTDVEMTASSGYYIATYNTDYNSWIQFIRKNSAGTEVWANSNTISVPTSDMYYEQGQAWSNWNPTTSTSLSSSWLLAANRHIANDYKDWDDNASNSANNVMSTTDKINYTVSVSNRPLKAGSYGFKFVGDNWYGNPDDSGNNYYIEIANDDKYDITYTFNRITKRGSAVATAKNLSPTIEYKYYIYDKDAASWKYDETNYITAFTGQTNWSECEMTNVNGTYVYGISGKALTSGKRYGSRFVEKVIATGASDQTNYLWISNENGASQGCRYYDCTSNGTYNIVFSYNPSASNYDLVIAQPKLSVTTGLYAAQSDAWSTGLPMTFDATNGVYKYNFAGIKGKYFVLSTNDDVTSSWDSYAIRPESGANGSYDVNAFNIFTGTGVTGSGNGKTWQLPSDKDIENVEITFRPTDYHWEVTPYITGSITSVGYATYSHGNAYKITGENVEVRTVTAAPETGTVTFSDDLNGAELPAGTGVILKGNSGSATPYTVYPSDGSATGDAITNNKLVGSGNSTQSISSLYNSESQIAYIFANKSHGVGFYSYNTGATEEAAQLAAHKCLLVIAKEPGAPEFLGFDFGGETTNISEKVIVNSEKFATAPVFNLKGQRVMNPTKGLYIVNGKKVVLK